MRRVHVDRDGTQEFLMRPVTPAERRVLNFIVDYTTEHGYAPTFRDICDGLGYSSTNAAVCFLRQLERRGVLTWTPGLARTIRIVGESR